MSEIYQPPFHMTEEITNLIVEIGLIIPAPFEPPVRTLRATIPENGSH